MRLAKRFLIDTLAAGIAGARTPVVESTIARRAGRLRRQRRIGGRCGAATERLPAPQAALVNGTAAHALELDDFGGCGHSGAVVIPVVCALAARGGVSGREALVAIARRLRPRGARARRRRRLSAAQRRSAGTRPAPAAASARPRRRRECSASTANASPTRSASPAPSPAASGPSSPTAPMTKRFHPGKTAENGLIGGACSRRPGMTGPRQVLEAEWGGFFGTYSPGIATPELTLEGLGTRVSHRPLRHEAAMPAAAVCTPRIDALLELMAETGCRAGDIAAMIVHGNAQTVRQFDRKEIATCSTRSSACTTRSPSSPTSGRATLDQFAPLPRRRARDPAPDARDPRRRRPHARARRVPAARAAPEGRAPLRARTSRSARARRKTRSATPSSRSRSRA